MVSLVQISILKLYQTVIIRFCCCQSIFCHPEKVYEPQDIGIFIDIIILFSKYKVIVLELYVYVHISRRQNRFASLPQPVGDVQFPISASNFSFLQLVWRNIGNIHVSFTHQLLLFDAGHGKKSPFFPRGFQDIVPLFSIRFWAHNFLNDWISTLIASVHMPTMKRLQSMLLHLDV